ncbi:MAG: RNA polymerase sigma-H factor [Firmicutes bacterium ADurb.Bin182]|nr:MAG: RNA polymerase sigma-H factor [Firmicutes bacterium ADurb.Bin182]
MDADLINYNDLTDEQIIKLSQHSDRFAEEVIYERYKNFVRSKARSYFLAGADREDLIQEGMIGLYKAIRDFNEEKQTTFRTFAEMCILRQIITAIKTATRLKHMPLNNYLSLNKPLYDDETDRTLMDTLASVHMVNPEEILINEEEYKSIMLKIDNLLSGLEKQTLYYYLEGRSYQEIAKKLKRSTKSVDNALQRIKKKLETHYESKNAESGA